MSSDSSPCRWRVFTLCGFLFSLLLVGSPVAFALPEDAPVLISEPNSTRAFIAVSRKSETAVKILPPNAATRVTFFVMNLADLMVGEDATAFRAEAEDVLGKRYPFLIESLAPVEGRQWVYALSVRINPEIGDVGDVLVRVTWRGVSSNRVRLAIGHEGGKIQDDPDSAPTPMPEKPPAATAARNGASPALYYGDRIRFLNQATFGATPELEARLRRISFSTWIAEQTEQKYEGNCNPNQSPACIERFSSIPYPTDLPLMITQIDLACGTNATCIRDNYSMFKLQNWFHREALYGEDQQLRRRVAWGLSQIFVVSGRETVQPSRMLYYVKAIDKQAFGNYRDLLKEMTLQPAMGNYLDMARSTAQNPNENYAREILQLFSIGLVMLNQNGTPILDNNGNQIPSYDQNIVNGFTKVFTGWTFAPPLPDAVVNYRDPMVLNPANHDTTQKTVLSYPGASSIIPAGQTGEQDLEMAIDNIFYHPNVAPFVGKLMIQQLVTSNPTPAYVRRVARAFEGYEGEETSPRYPRGDMKRLIRAILLDPEARGNVKTDPDYGHLKEPNLFVTNFLRAFKVGANTTLTTCNGQSDGVLNSLTAGMDQDVFNSPTVFNYYPFDYVIPSTNLAGPEFAIMTTGTTLKRPNFVNQMIAPGGTTTPGIPANNATLGTTCGTAVNITEFQTPAQNDLTGNQLVDALDKQLLNGSMSAGMRGEILTAVQAVAATNPLKRARTAIYLITTSSQYQVQR